MDAPTNIASVPPASRGAINSTLPNWSASTTDVSAVDNLRTPAGAVPVPAGPRISNCAPGAVVLMPTFPAVSTVITAEPSSSRMTILSPVDAFISPSVSTMIQFTLKDPFAILFYPNL